jgi:DNA invertase Pin-like site-specific DNA recombinase
MRIGYARVSTDEQSLDLQLDALKKVGCKRVFTDKASAAKGERPGLAEAVSHLRPGDLLVIWKLDRLGRTVKGLVDFVADLQGRGVQFRSLTDGIDTTTPAGRFFFHVMASLVQMERELLAERTRAGLAAARRRGRVGGRKRRMTPGKVESARKLLRGGMSPRGRGREPRRLGPDALSLGARVEPVSQPFDGRGTSLPTTGLGEQMGPTE